MITMTPEQVQRLAAGAEERHRKIISDLNARDDVRALVRGDFHPDIVSYEIDILYK